MDRLLEDGGNGFWRDGDELGAIEVRCQRRGRGCFMGAEMYDTATDASNGTKTCIAATSEANNFAADTIFLSREREGAEGGCCDVRVRGRSQIEPLSADPELDVLDPKWCRVRFCARVFSWTEEEEEREGNHVGDCHGGDCRGCERDKKDVPDYRDRNGFYSMGWGVGFGVRLQLSLKAEVGLAIGV
jgi:hypothetical protein